MDLIQVLRNKVAGTDEGEHMAGLKAVLLHIETAFAHYARGESSGDDTAFTDAIYRANQAFEGSVKEAYRVLTGNDPARKTPSEIEKYLEANKILRTRVLLQLSNYRSQWRNPSTHDYKLDFDQSESLLAAVSVSAFAAMLIEEIQQKLAFNKSQAEATAAVDASKTDAGRPSERVDLEEEVLRLLTQFCEVNVYALDGKLVHSESQIMGAIQGFLAITAPHLNVNAEFQLKSQESATVDLLISRNNEKMVVEVKRRLVISDVPRSVLQLERYLRLGDMTKGILFYLPGEPSEMEVIPFQSNDRRIYILAPEGFIKASPNS